MSRPAYTFRVKISNCEDPTVIRTFTLPATSSFSRLHYAIQYSFGWMSVNEHEFLFMEPSDAPGALLCIENRRRPHDTCAHRIQEEKVFLCGIWGHFSTGMLKRRLARNEKVVPLEYCYECEGGGAWVLEIDVVDMNATIDRNYRMEEAIGCAPMEECQNPDEWRRIKAAFANPQGEDGHEGIEYARRISRLQGEFNPFLTPRITGMNEPGLFEGFEKLYRVLDESDDPLEILDYIYQISQ